MPSAKAPKPRPAYDFEAAASPRRWFRSAGVLAALAVFTVIGYAMLRDTAAPPPGAVSIAEAFVAGPPGAESVASAALARETHASLREGLKADTGREARRVGTLIERARLAAAAGDFDGPPGRSAVDYYAQALALDVANQAARAGQAALPQAALERARAAAARGETDTVAAALAAAERLGIPATEVAALRQSLAQVTGQHRATDAADARIETLVRRAESAREAGRLVAPPGDNARELYRQVLALAPDNAAAEAGLNAIVDRLLAAADAALAAGDTAGALASLETAAAVRPDSAAVAAARRRVGGAP